MDKQYQSFTTVSFETKPKQKCICSAIATEWLHNPVAQLFTHEVIISAHPNHNEYQEALACMTIDNA